MNLPYSNYVAHSHEFKTFRAVGNWKYQLFTWNCALGSGSRLVVSIYRTAQENNNILKSSNLLKIGAKMRRGALRKLAVKKRDTKEAKPKLGHLLQD